MLVRPAVVDDVPAVLPMVAQLAALHRGWDPAKYDYRDGVEAMYAGWLRARVTDRRAVFLVAEREGRGPVGFLIGSVEREIPVYKLAEYGFVHDLWVDPGYRNEGVARQLVMQAVEAFAEIGVTQVRLDTAAENEVARKLFASCGFRVSNVEMLLEIDKGQEGAS